MAVASQLHVISKSIFSFSLAKRSMTNVRTAKLCFPARNIMSTQLLHEEKKEVNVVFIMTSGQKIKAKGQVGDTMWDIVKQNEILQSEDLDWCDGHGICCSCQLILTKKDYDKTGGPFLCEDITLSGGCINATETSRMSCQITMSEDLDGIEVNLPPKCC